MPARTYGARVTTFLAGLLMGLTLIVAIGAQNVFVLRQGIRREHVGPVVAVCAVSDALLITLGVGGVGRLVTEVPWLVATASWAGAAFLLGYAALAARRALLSPGEALVPDEGRPAPVVPEPAVSGPAVGGGHGGTGAATLTRRAAAPVVATTLALTWLNPHVYLDTVFLLGTIAASYDGARWVFGAGAVLGSLIWFTGLGYGARYLSRWLRSPRSWRWLDGGIAVVMAVMGVRLAIG